jgi:hypothetical protein
MNMTYEYLKKYMWKTYEGKEVEIESNNIFYEVTEEEIRENEKKLGQKFPPELRSFYLKIGCGHLTTPETPSKDYIFYASNEILPPNIAVDYMLGILEHPDDDAYYMSSSAHEVLGANDLPFFEIGDGSSFMVMKLDSDNPNAVWYMGVEKIEDSLERFIWRLYHESPDYYTKNW